jgi:hypothetical protein
MPLHLKDTRPMRAGFALPVVPAASRAASAHSAAAHDAAPAPASAAAPAAVPPVSGMTPAAAVPARAVDGAVTPSVPGVAVRVAVAVGTVAGAHDFDAGRHGHTDADGHLRGSLLFAGKEPDRERTRGDDGKKKTTESRRELHGTR